MDLRYAYEWVASLYYICIHKYIQKQAGELIDKYIQDNNISYDLICGVPYGAFAVATALSIRAEKPMVFKRKEAKDYGCKKMVEGVYNAGENCLIIEDVVVYGTSIIETYEVGNSFCSLIYLSKLNIFFSTWTKKCLKDYKLNVKDAITLLDREQGGPDNIDEHGIKFHRYICLF